MRLRELTLEDTIAVARQLPEDEHALYRSMTGASFNPHFVAQECFLAPGLKQCMVDDAGEPVVACGYAWQRRGVYRSWFLAAPRAWTEHGAVVTRLSCDLIWDTLAREAHRLETVTLASRRRARRWYSLLGLQHESTMPGWGADGQTYVMYVATRPVETL